MNMPYATVSPATCVDSTITLLNATAEAVDGLVQAGAQFLERSSSWESESGHQAAWHVTHPVRPKEIELRRIYRAVAEQLGQWTFQHRAFTRPAIAT